MKITCKFSNISVVIAIILATVILVGCSSTNPQIIAIQDIRKNLFLPNLPLYFVEMTTMNNSPSGNLEVAQYKDSEGRLYYVEPKTNQVVEINALRNLLSIPFDSVILSANELKSIAMEFARIIIPDFDSRQSSLDYEEGAVGALYFFTWYGEMIPDMMNRPYLKIGIQRSGVLFSYHNTLLLTNE